MLMLRNFMVILRVWLGNKAVGEGMHAEKGWLG